MKTIYCEHCKKELNVIPLNKAIKNKAWWKYELRDFGFGNLLIIIAIILLFSSIFFEFGPKIKNPCDWCKVSVKESNGETTQKTCTQWMKEKYGSGGFEYDLNIAEVMNGSASSLHPQ